MPALDSPSLLQLLKDQTRSHHERAERVVPLMSPALSLADYRRHLEALLGLYEPLESAVTARLGERFPSLRLPERGKVGLLREDLRALGHDEGSLCGLPRVRPLELSGEPEALGALYVMEGATLGGQLLLRHLRRHFAHGAAGPFSFFQAYGEAVGPMWKAFGEALLGACPEPALAPRVVRGAQDTFELFESWLGEGQR